MTLLKEARRVASFLGGTVKPANYHLGCHGCLKKTEKGTAESVVWYKGKYSHTVSRCSCGNYDVAGYSCIFGDNIWSVMGKVVSARS